MRGSSLTQMHLLKVNIGFHVVNLIVKFSCDIVLALKTKENKLICETLPRPLCQGRSQINQQLQIQWQSIYDVGRSEYMQTSMQIVVMVNSINGNIQAGICNIDIARLMNQSTIPLKKCSDKSASICLSSNFQFLHVIQQKDNFQYTKDAVNLLNNSVNHAIKRMKSLQFLQKNEESQLSISKISVSNKRLQSFLRSENEQLQRECQILQGKLKFSQKKQKELMQQLKQSMVKYDKLNNRSSSFQNTSQHNAIIFAQKDRIIKNYEHDLKSKEVKLKEMIDNQLTLQRKIEQKQQTYQDQIKKLSQKYNQSQAQLQEAIQQQNTLLSKFQSIQKNSQTILKERQKAFILERAKITKDATSERQRILKLLQKANNELKDKSLQLQQMHKQQFKINSLEDKVYQLNQQLSIIRQENIRVNKQYKEIQEQFQELKRNNQQRLPFRRKINDLQSENNNLKIQIEKINQAVFANDYKMGQLNQKQLQHDNEKKIQKMKMDELHDTNVSLKNKYSELQKQVNHYRQNDQKTMQMLKDIKEKKQQTQYRLKEQLQEWGRQIEMLGSQRAHLQAENNEMRWQIEQYQSGLRQSQSTAHSYKAELFELTKEIIIKTQQYEKAEVQKLQLQQVLQKIQQKLLISQSKVNELLKSNSQKTSQITLANIQLQQKQKIVVELTQENTSLIQQLKIQTNKHQLQQTGLQKYAQIQQTEIKRLQHELNIKYQQIQNLTKHLKVAQLNLDGILAENQVLSDQNIKFSTDMSQKQSLIKSLKQITQEQQKQIDEVKKSLSTTKQQYNHLLKQYNTYKQSNNDAVRWILCLLGQEQIIVEEQTVLFTEPNLRDLQIQAINNRNLLLTKIRNTIKSIKEQKEFITFQLEKIGQQLIDSTNDFEEQLQRQRNQKEIAIKQLLAERKSLLHQMEELNIDLQDLKDKNENYFKQNRLFQHQQEQIQKEKVKLLQQKIEFIQKIKENQTEIGQLTTKVSNLQRQIVVKEAMLVEQKNSVSHQQKDRFQQQIGFLKLKLTAREAEINQKLSKVKQLQQKCIVLQSQKRMAQYSLSVKQQLITNIQNKLEDTLKFKAEVIPKIKQLEVELQRKEKQILQKQLYSLQNQNVKSQYQIKLNQLAKEKQQLNREINQYEQELIIKVQQIKHARLKTKQMEDFANKNKQMFDAQLSKAAGQISIYKLMIGQSQTKLKQASQKINHYHQEFQSKRQHIMRIQSDYQMIQKQVYFEQSHKNTLHREYQELLQNYQHAKSEIYLLEQEKLKLNQEIQSLNQENFTKDRKIQQSMKNSRARVTRQIIDLKKKIQNQQQKNAKLQAKCQQLKNYLKEIESIVDKNQFSLLVCEQEKQKIKCDYEEQIERLQQKLQKMHEKQEELASDYKQQRQHLMRQIQQLNQQCTQLNQLIRKKQEELEDNSREQDSSLRKIAFLESEIKLMEQPKRSTPQDQTPQSLKHLMKELDGHSIQQIQKKAQSKQFLQ